MARKQRNNIGNNRRGSADYFDEDSHRVVKEKFAQSREASAPSKGIEFIPGQIIRNASSDTCEKVENWFGELEYKVVANLCVLHTMHLKCLKNERLKRFI